MWELFWKSKDFFPSDTHLSTVFKNWKENTLLLQLLKEFLKNYKRVCLKFGKLMIKEIKIKNIVPVGFITFENLLQLNTILESQQF